MRKVLGYWKTFLVGGGIAYLSFMRTTRIQLPDISHSDKWAHCIMYFALAAVWLWDLTNARVSQTKRIILGLACPILYGGLIEILQERFFYPRTGDWKDWVADMVGSVIGVALTYLIWKMRKN